MTAAHPLVALLTDAAVGRFPPADGGWRRVAPWQAGLEAVIAFTGHTVLAVADDPCPVGSGRPGSGVGGLTELSLELEPGRRGWGEGAALVAAALAWVPAGELVVAAVAPGNAASLRALLAAGFVPVGSLQLFRR